MAAKRNLFSGNKFEFVKIRPKKDSRHHLPTKIFEKRLQIRVENLKIENAKSADYIFNVVGKTRPLFDYFRPFLNTNIVQNVFIEA